MPDEIELWLWEYIDAQGKRRVTRYKLDRKTALEQYGPLAKAVDHSREVRRGLGTNTSDFLRRS